MYKVASKVLRFPYYPWLLGIYPILHLYAENFGLVLDSEVIPSVLLVLAGTSVAFYIANRQIRDIHKTGLIIALGSLTYSLSGHIYVLVFMPKSLGIWTMIVLIGLAAIISALRRMRSTEFFAKATPGFNLVALIMLALRMIGLTADIVEQWKYDHIYSDDSVAKTSKQVANKQEDSSTRPDIYYIIPDAYPSDAWSKSAMNYDNSKFTKALVDRGFVVVGHAQSNYDYTLLSLASVLNMRFYDINQSPYRDLDYLWLEVANNRVARQLAENGYTYIQLLSGFLAPSIMADINRDFTPRGPIDIEVDRHAMSGRIFKGTFPGQQSIGPINLLYKRSFYNLYIETTLLRLVRSRLEKLLQRSLFVPYDSFAPERFLATIDEIETVAAMPEATFAVVHLLKPHWPVVFNARGEYVDTKLEPTAEEYFAELEYVNSRFLHMIDTILATSQNLPIIVFQADHGSLYGKVIVDGWKRKHHDIYAAYFLPHKFSIEIPTPFTSINTFPLILNALLGSGYELQADKLYQAVLGFKAPFEQLDLTEDYLN